MRLLVITQKVDRDDDVLGFFHEWLRWLAERVERLEVICLYEGAHDLPANVTVHSLGKEGGASRVKHLVRLFRYVFSLNYDSVFVHMNEEYALLCGLWWRLTGKRVILWRNHKKGSWRTRVAMGLSSAVCHTSPDAFVAHSPKALRMPIGIDTDAFAPGEARSADSILFLGRLDPVKKAEVFIDALTSVTVPFRANMYGSPTEPDSAYAAEIAAHAQPLVGNGKLTLHPGVPFVKTSELYRSHAIYVNLTPSGSFDKTIGEAMASGCVVVCANEALRGAVPDWCLAVGSPGVAKALAAALSLPLVERAELSRANRAYVEREHSLRLLIDRLVAILKP